MKRLLLFVFLSASAFYWAQSVSGTVLSEEGIVLPKVLVVNMATNQKVYTDVFGSFTILGKAGDELRFAKENYKAEKTVILSNTLTIHLEKIPQEIEEVRIVDKRLAESQKEKLRKDIGLPKGPEKLREKPVEAKEVLLPLVFAQLNIDNLYKWLSGNSRRLKRLYKYEDLQEGLAWIQNNVDLEYFAEAGIPPEKFNDFLMFSLRDEKVLMYMKAKNIGGLTVTLDGHIAPYLEVLSRKK